MGYDCQLENSNSAVTKEVINVCLLLAQLSVTCIDTIFASS